MGPLELGTEAFLLSSKTATIVGQEVTLDVKDLGGIDEGAIRIVRTSWQHAGR